MKKIYFLFLFIVACSDSITKKEYKSPDDRWGEIYKKVIQASIFSSEKIFADAIPLYPDKEIIDSFDEKNLKSWVLTHFKFDTIGFKTYNNWNDALGSTLRNPVDDLGALMPTRKPYLASSITEKSFDAGTVFFALQGIENDSIKNNMALNLAQYIQDFGSIPAGNKTYLQDRKKLPYFSMIYALVNNNNLLPQLAQEYNFWMAATSRNDVNKINALLPFQNFKNVVKFPNSNQLNVYYTSVNKPRCEYYLEDKDNFIEIRNIETSNWNDKKRWEGSVSNYVPLELNALLYHFEITLANEYRKANQPKYAQSYQNLAQKRKQMINSYLWNGTIFVDYNFKKNYKSQYSCVATVFPMWVKLASTEQAVSIKKYLIEHLNAYQDDPIWCWIVFEALKNYNFDHEANIIKEACLKNASIEESNTGNLGVLIDLKKLKK